MSLFRMLMARRAGGALELTPEELLFGAPGGTQGLTVRANRKWTLTAEDGNEEDETDNKQQ